MANEVYIDTALDTKSLEKGIAKVERDLGKLESSYDKLIQKQKEMVDSGQNQVLSEEYKQAQAEVEKLTSKYNSLLEKKQKMEDLGVNANSKQYKSLEHDLMTVGERLDDAKIKLEKLEGSKYVENPTFKKLTADAEETKNKIDNTNVAITDMKNRLSQMKTAENSTNTLRNMFDKLKQSIAGVGKQSNNVFGKGLKMIMKYALGIRSVYILVRKVKQAITEGFKNLAQFNKGVNPTNTALSNLKSALTQLKNALATAFAPILTVIEPILTRLIGLITNVATVVAQFFAALTGSKTFYKAIKVQQDYAKSLSGTAKSAKKAKGALASFDKLNNRTDSDNGGGSTDPNKMFKLDEVDTKISTLAEKIRTLFAPFKDSITNWVKSIDFTPLLTSIENLKTAIEPLLTTISAGLLFFLENVLEPIGSFVIEEALPKFFDMVATAMSTLNDILVVLAPSFTEFYEKALKPIGEFLGEVLLWAIDTIQQAFEEFGEMFVQNGDDINKIISVLIKVTEIAWLKFKAVCQFAMGAISTLLSYSIKVVGDLINVFGGIIDFFEGVFAGDWEKALTGLANVARGIFNGIIDMFEGVVNAIINGLNKISFTIPDWAPEPYKGKTFGFDLEKLDLSKFKLPMLASGTVVPRASKEFAAILGDNNKETEVVSPLSTMKQALKEALGEFGGTDSTINLNVYLDGDVVYKDVVRKNNMAKARLGYSQLA